MKNEMIAKVLKKYRKHNNYTVSDVANMLEDKSIRVAEKTIYGWESGQSQPDADTLLMLCDIYNINDILATFGYTNDKHFILTNHEKELIEKYRKHPELQKAVDKLLD